MLPPEIEFGDASIHEMVIVFVKCRFCDLDQNSQLILFPVCWWAFVKPTLRLSIKKCLLVLVEVRS